MSLRINDPHSGRLLLKALALVAVLILIAGAAYLVLKPKAAGQAGAVVGFSPPPTTQPLHVVIIRGGATGCRATGGCNDANYAQVLSAKEGWTTTVLAQGGTGYVGGSDQDPAEDFVSRLPDVYNANPDLVIVEGSVGDQYYTGAAIQQAAHEVFAELKSHLPNAKIVAVGPAWANTPPATIVAAEDAVKAAARAEDIFFIDPIAQGWFDGTSASLMAPDFQSPTDQGHAHMAAMIAADLALLLHQQPSSSSPAA